MKAIWILSAICLFGCSKKDPGPYVNTGQDLLVNGDVETGSGAPKVPNEWTPTPPGGPYQLSWSTEESASASHSLKISVTSPEPTNYAVWLQTYGKVMPVGKPLLLTAKVKGELTGDGIALVIRGDVTAGGIAEQYVTTQGSTPITGTFDWTTYEVKITTVPSEMKVYTVYLIFLPNTSGKVYFDDIKLTY